MFKEQETVVEITGKGQTKQEAISRALSLIQKQLFAETDSLLIKVEPLAVEVIDAIQKRYTERFLFLFLPREKVTYQVTLRVKVGLKTLDPEAIQWEDVIKEPNKEEVTV